VSLIFRQKPPEAVDYMPGTQVTMCSQWF